MNAFPRELRDLFLQLGLPSADADIDNFVAGHRISHGSLVCDAPFWNPGQRQFLQEALEADSEWAEMVDSLATLLTDRSPAPDPAR